MKIYHPLHILLFLLFSLSLHSTKSSAARCPRGTHHTKSGGCKPCPPGTYRILAFRPPKFHCTPCPPGTYNPHPRNGFLSNCIPCPPNTHSPTKGATSCKPCPAGTVARYGAARCLSCGPGERPADFDFVLHEGARKCEPCPPSTYSSARVNADCRRCPEGLGAPAGSKALSDCVLCPAGYEASSSISNPSGCLKCSSGTFKAVASRGRCESCMPGFIRRAMGARRCKPCPMNTRQRKYYEECIPCPSGTRTFGEGNSICRAIGKACPLTTFEDALGDCRQCRPNYAANAERTECEKCAEGFRATGRMEKCEKCPVGQIATSNGRRCRCGEGLFVTKDGKCQPCPPGYFAKKDYFGVDETQCHKCSGGVAEGVGNKICTPCPDMLVPNADHSKCVPCPKGLMKNVPETDYDTMEFCVNVTTGCAPLFTREDIYSDCMPIVCQPGEEALMGVQCMGCERGYALLGVSRRGKRFCRQCARTSVSEGGVVTECTACEKGMMRDVDDGGRCSCRREGYGVGGDGECKVCESGFFSGGDSEVCKECPMGMMGKKKGLGKCEKCGYGTFKSKRGAGKCKKCPSGKVPNRKVMATKCVDA